MQSDSSSGALSRRGFLQAVAAFALIPQQVDSLAGRGATGTLRDPSALGRSRLPTARQENSDEIQAIERQLACNCGCTLDVFTCRTTDFSCTYSPKLHQEVLALRDQGKSAREILDAFVQKYGEKALMAPKPRGFNLWGYFLPGAAVAAAGVALAAVLRRRETLHAMAEAPPPQPVRASAEELDRLRAALDQVED